MWVLFGPGIEPVSLALAGGFLSTVPPGKSINVDLGVDFKIYVIKLFWTKFSILFKFVFLYMSITVEKLRNIEILCTSESCSRVCRTLCNPMDYGILRPWNSPGQNTGVGSLSLLQGILPTQGSNLGLPNCRQILYQLSHKGSPEIDTISIWPFPYCYEVAWRCTWKVHICSRFSVHFLQWKNPNNFDQHGF